MKEWDMVKFILFASVILCLAGVGFYVFQKQDLQTLVNDIPRCATKLTRIGELSAEVEIRRNELERDKRQGLQLSQYVEEQANAAGIPYRRYLGWKPLPENRNQQGGYVDRPFEIKPEGKKKFSRKKIASFIFNLENYTNRLKVTELTLEKPTADHEEWNMYLQVTERAPIEK